MHLTILAQLFGLKYFSVILVQERYDKFKESIAKESRRDPTRDSSRNTARDHPSVIEVPLFLLAFVFFGSLFGNVPV